MPQVLFHIFSFCFLLYGLFSTLFVLLLNLQHNVHIYSWSGHPKTLLSFVFGDLVQPWLVRSLSSLSFIPPWGAIPALLDSLLSSVIFSLKTSKLKSIHHHLCTDEPQICVYDLFLNLRPAVLPQCLTHTSKSPCPK